jgi:Rab GDP dissociation inhibitor
LKVSIPHFSLPSPFSIHSFDAIDDRMAPVGDGSADNCYISKSLDATSNFETMALDCLNLHERVFGTELDMTISADSVEEQ